jgi:hypothetical protein
MQARRFLLVGTLLLPAPAFAQERLGALPWGPWGPTYWNTMESRVKCDGSMPFALSTRWRVSIRNVGEKTVFLYYVISYSGSALAEPKPRRISIEPRKSKEISVELSTDCTAQILTRITNVRVGGDTDDIPYLPPESPR